MRRHCCVHSPYCGISPHCCSLLRQQMGNEIENKTSYITAHSLPSNDEQNETLGAVGFIGSSDVSRAQTLIESGSLLLLHQPRKVPRFVYDRCRQCGAQRTFHSSRKIRWAKSRTKTLFSKDFLNQKFPLRTKRFSHVS